MHEPVPRCQRSIRKLVLVTAMDERVDALEVDEPFLHVCRIGIDCGSDHSGIEIVSLYRSRDEKLAVGLAQLSDLALHHAAHGFGKVALEIRK